MSKILTDSFDAIYLCDACRAALAAGTPPQHRALHFIAHGPYTNTMHVVQLIDCPPPQEHNPTYAF
jgi:hypothetical protein